MADRVSLDGIMLKCNQDPAKLQGTTECENARVAIDRLAAQEVDPSIEKKRQEEFEKARERLRLEQEKQIEAQEAKSKVDAYSLPVVPVNPANAPAAAPATSSATSPAPATSP